MIILRSTLVYFPGRKRMHNFISVSYYTRRWYNFLVENECTTIFLSLFCMLAKAIKFEDSFRLPNGQRADHSVTTNFTTYRAIHGNSESFLVHFIQVHYCIKHRLSYYYLQHSRVKTSLLSLIGQTFSKCLFFLRYTVSTYPKNHCNFPRSENHIYTMPPSYMIRARRVVAIVAVFAVGPTLYPVCIINNTSSYIKLRNFPGHQICQISSLNCFTTMTTKRT